MESINNEIITKSIFLLDYISIDRFIRELRILAYAIVTFPKRVAISNFIIQIVLLPNFISKFLWVFLTITSFRSQITWLFMRFWIFIIPTTRLKQCWLESAFIPWFLKFNILKPSILLLLMFIMMIWCIAIQLLKYGLIV